MPDPLSLIALGAAIGGGAGKFVEKAWDSGERWIISYFESHQDKAKEKAIENSTTFLLKLGNNIAELEKAEDISEVTIAQAQEHPDFSVILQKAILSAAQTDNEVKHNLLACLISERIKSPPETIFSMATKIACDAISFTTPNQLEILALLNNINKKIPSKVETHSQYISWLEYYISPFININASVNNYIHLESLSCVKYYSFFSNDLKRTIGKNHPNTFNYDLFIETELGKRLEYIIEKELLGHNQLTIVGKILGAMVSDQVLRGDTEMFDIEDYL